MLEHFVPRQTALSAIQFVMQQEPSVGVEILSSNGRMYLPHCCEYICRHAAHESLPYVAAQLDDIRGDWYKILFAGSPSEIAKLEGLVQQQEWENAYFTATNQNYLELMPRVWTKAAPFRSCAAVLGRLSRMSLQSVIIIMIFLCFKSAAIRSLSAMQWHRSNSQVRFRYCPVVTAGLLSCCMI